MTKSGKKKPFQVWWVNQGHTYAKAKEEGFLWAPIPAKGGQGFPHWESMTKVKAGDLIINCGHKQVMAFSLARSRAVKHQNRKSEGWRVDLDYHDLEMPIDLDDIKPYMERIASSIPDNRPFDELHNVLQGYLFNFSHVGLDILADLYPDRLPEQIRIYLGLESRMTFDAFAHGLGFVFDQELITRYVLSLKSSHFVVLSGKSGTGKSGLARLYARYLDETERTLRAPLENGSALLKRRWYKLSYNDKTIVNAFEGRGPKINLVRKTILKDGIMSLLGLDSKKNIDMNQKKMMKDLQVGDIIIAYEGGYTVGGIGLVTEPHFYDDFGDAFDSFFESTKNFIRIDWIFKGPLKINDFFLNDGTTPAFSMWGETIHPLDEGQIGQFVAYLYGKGIHLDGDRIQKTAKTYEVVPVNPGWNDRSPLLGTYDPVADEYRTTKALELILNATEASQKGCERPFFLILDGMNTVPPMNYLADILSSMDSGEPVPLHSSDEVSQYTRIPRDLIFPPNLCIVGTLHDGGIHPEPVILDRCNVIEMPVPDGSAYLENFNGPDFYSREPGTNPMIPLGALIYRHVIEQMNVVRIPIDGQQDFHLAMASEINRLQRHLDALDCGLGYRVIQSMMVYLFMAWSQERKPFSWDGWADAFDIQILQRILPRVKGSDKMISEPLLALYHYCFEETSGDPDEARARFRRTARKIQIMLNDLDQSGAASFFR